MIEFLKTPDWCLVIVEIVGIIVSAFMLWIVAITIPRRKEKKEREAQLLNHLLEGFSDLEGSRL